MRIRSRLVARAYLQVDDPILAVMGVHVDAVIEQRVASRVLPDDRWTRTADDVSLQEQRLAEEDAALMRGEIQFGSTVTESTTKPLERQRKHDYRIDQILYRYIEGVKTCRDARGRRRRRQRQQQRHDIDRNKRKIHRT